MMRLSNKEVMYRVTERYSLAQLAEELELEYILDDAPELDIEQFIQIFRTKIITEKDRLDIW